MPCARRTVRVLLSMAVYGDLVKIASVFAHRASSALPRDSFTLISQHCDPSSLSASSTFLMVVGQRSYNHTIPVSWPRTPIFVAAASQFGSTTLQDRLEDIQIDKPGFPYSHTFAGARWIRRNSTEGQFFPASGDQKYQLTVERKPASDLE